MEDLCLYKLQVQKRISRGHIVETKCSYCDGRNLYCDDYTSLRNQRELINSIADNLGDNWKWENQNKIERREDCN